MGINPEVAARSLEAVGPDQYPTSFYQRLVDQKVADGLDWQEKFRHLYEAICAAEAPEGSQVDDALRAFMVEYHLSKSGG